MLEDSMKVLFGDDQDPLIIEAFEILSMDKSYGQRCNDLLALCMRATSYKSISRILVAATAAAPGQSYMLLKVIARSFSGDIDLTPAFVQGVALGVFRSSNWLDKNWRIINHFDDELVRVIPDMVFSSVAAVDIESEFENKLKQEVIQYPRGLEHYQGHRLSNVHQIVTTLGDRERRTGTKDVSINSVGNIIIDGLCYSVFGSVSTTARLRAIAGIFKSVLEGLHKNAQTS